MAAQVNNQLDAAMREHQAMNPCSFVSVKLSVPVGLHER